MSRDPNSYRVPVLNLTDIYNSEENHEEDVANDDIDNAVAPNQKNTKEKIQNTTETKIKEEDIEKAIIKPSQVIPDNNLQQQKTSNDTIKQKFKQILKKTPIQPTTESTQNKEKETKATVQKSTDRIKQITEKETDVQNPNLIQKKKNININESKERQIPNTKHARALSNIAERLQNLDDKQIIKKKTILKNADHINIKTENKEQTQNDSTEIKDIVDTYINVIQEKNTYSNKNIGTKTTNQEQDSQLNINQLDNKIPHKTQEKIKKINQTNENYVKIPSNPPDIWEKDNLKTKKTNVTHINITNDDTKVSIDNNEEKSNTKVVSNLSDLKERVLKKSLLDNQTTQTNEETTATEQRGEVINTNIEEKQNKKRSYTLSDAAEHLQKIGNKNIPIKNMPPQKEASETVKNKSAKIEQTPTPKIRTFRSDMEQAIIKNRTSVIDMVSAEQKKQEKDETVRKARPHNQITRTTYVFIALSSLFILSSIFIGVFFFIKFMSIDADLTPIEEIVASNEMMYYDTTQKDRNEILQGLANIRENMQKEKNHITEIKIIKRKDKEDLQSKKIELKPRDFFLKIDSRIPGELLRSIKHPMAIGIHKLEKNEVFIVFKITDHQLAYRGMFEWENKIYNDFAPLFGPKIEDDKLTSNNGTTTKETAFKDAVISNVEVRELYSSDGKPILLWAMPNESTIIITTNEKTMRTLVERVIIST